LAKCRSQKHQFQQQTGCAIEIGRLPALADWLLKKQSNCLSVLRAKASTIAVVDVFVEDNDVNFANVNEALKMIVFTSVAFVHNVRNFEEIQSDCYFLQQKKNCNQPKFVNQ
jgi:hypothetical protein